MRSLFWKIFLFFWVTLILTTASVVTLTGTIIENRQKLESHQIIEIAVKLTDTYEKDGRKRLAHELREVDEHHGIKAFISR